MSGQVNNDVEAGNAKESFSSPSNEKRRSNKKIFLIAILAFLLGAGIVAAVWFILDKRSNDSPTPANINPDAVPNEAPTNPPGLSPTPPPTNRGGGITGPTPSPAPTTELERLFNEHGPLWDDAANWLFSTDMYEPQSYSDLQERYALAVLFYRTRGVNLWNFKQGWLSMGSVCSGWYGISCNGQGQVDKIELLSNSLVGSLPTELGILTALTSIDIFNNYELTGPIPSELSRLTTLRSLILRNNYLSGQIPGSLTGMNSLTTLDLENNILSGSLAGSISSMTNLVQLSAGGNELEGSIPEMDALTNLAILELDRNKLGGFIPEIITLTNLQKLDLKTNKLTGNVPRLPNSIQDCDLDWNSFTNIENGVQKQCFD